MVENYVSGIFFYASGKRQPILRERYDLTTYFDTFCARIIERRPLTCYENLQKGLSLLQVSGLAHWRKVDKGTVPLYNLRRTNDARYAVSSASPATRLMNDPNAPASTCWNSVPIMTGNTTSPGKNCPARTAPAEMLRIPVQKHDVTSRLRSRPRARAMSRPAANPHDA